MNQLKASTLKQQMKSLFASLGYQVEGTRFTPRQLLQPELLRSLTFDDVVCRLMFETGPQLSFIQVGAFDGLVQDPLRKYIERFNWHGLMVEPQPAPAQKLRELYQDNEHIQVIEAAIDHHTGERPFFSVSSPEAPNWAGALASFQKETILKHTHQIPGLEGMIHEVNVRCMTFDDVLTKLPAPNIDLLQIDTEGADAFILSLFPFARIKPAIVHWEVRHLSFQEREDCLERLVSFGYRLSPSGDQDMLAVLF